MTLNRFAKYAWFVVGYNVLVILWGAFVRASGSGAGCGSHWPLCNGEVVPLNPSIERVIEFTHRGMSGIDLPLVLILAVMVLRAYPWGRVRYMAIGSVFFILTEALIGMQLVRAGLVASNQSPERAFWVALHLLNTFFLLACLTLTAWWISGGKEINVRARPIHTIAMAIALLGIAIVSGAGALTALGDTLFPATSLVEGLQQDANPAAHFLVQLRVLHPLIAMLVGSYLLYLTVILNGRAASITRKFAMSLRFLVVVQILAGALNVALLAPTWMQLVHLLLADCVWIVLVLYAASVLAVERETTGETTPTRNAMRASAE